MLDGHVTVCAGCAAPQKGVKIQTMHTLIFLGRGWTPSTRIPPGRWCRLWAGFMAFPSAWSVTQIATRWTSIVVHSEDTHTKRLNSCAIHFPATDPIKFYWHRPIVTVNLHLIATTNWHVNVKLNSSATVRQTFHGKFKCWFFKFKFDHQTQI